MDGAPRRGYPHRMMFYLYKLAQVALLPDALLVLLSSAGLLLLWTRWRRLARFALAVGVGGLLACLLLPVDTWLIRPLEERFPRPAEPARVDGIVVLGGAINEILSADRDVPTLAPAAERVTEFVALARRWPDAKLVFTGGSGAPFPGGVPEAAWAERIFTALGVPPGRMLFEDASRTTEENATFTARLVHPQPGETWLLVTSAAHMPRSVGVFRRAGWTVLPWPVGYRSMRSAWSLRQITLGGKLQTLDQAAHEWGGLVAYRLLGRTDTVFPGPDGPPPEGR